MGFAPVKLQSFVLFKGNLHDVTKISILPVHPPVVFITPTASSSKAIKMLNREYHQEVAFVLPPEAGEGG